MSFEPDLIALARRFLELREARHAADYDLARSVTRFQVLDMIRGVQTVFDDWSRIRASPNAAVFLTALLLNRQWSRA